MTPEEMSAARDIRRYLERRAIDASLAIITISKGYATVAGTIRPQRSAQYVDMQEEIDLFTKMAMRNVRDLKGVIIEARVRTPAPVEKNAHGEQAGAHMPGHNPHSH
jgi:hypothetical protein